MQLTGAGIPSVSRAARAPLLVLVMALLAGGLTFGLSSSSWHSRAIVTIVPPQTGAQSRVDENALLRLDADLPQLVDVLATSMRSGSATRTLHRQGGTAASTIETGATQAAASGMTPQLSFTSTAGSAVLARRTVEALVLVARDQLDRLQNDAGVPGAARATVSVLAGPGPAVRSLNGRWTAAGRVALAVAVLLGAGVVVSRRRRRSSAQR